jgi:hypothetical protein
VSDSECHGPISFRQVLCDAHHLIVTRRERGLKPRRPVGRCHVEVVVIGPQNVQLPRILPLPLTGKIEGVIDSTPFPCLWPKAVTQEFDRFVLSFMGFARILRDQFVGECDSRQTSQHSGYQCAPVTEISHRYR